MKNKFIACFGLLALVCAFAISAKAEARSCFSLNIAGLFAAPQPVYERYVYVDNYYPGPVYVQPVPGPVYVQPTVVPAPGYYIAPRHHYRQVYVQPQPRVSTGVSFSFFN